MAEARLTVLSCLRRVGGQRQVGRLCCPTRCGQAGVTGQGQWKLITSPTLVFCGYEMMGVNETVVDTKDLQSCRGHS